MKLTLERVHRAKGRNPSVIVVRNENGFCLGMIKKYRKSAGNNPPYVAYHGTGADAPNLGAFYDAEPDISPNAQAGGKKAAIQAIVHSWKNLGIVKCSMREVPIVIEGDEFFVRHPTSGPYQSVFGPFKITDNRFIIPLRQRQNIVVFSPKTAGAVVFPSMMRVPNPKVTECC